MVGFQGRSLTPDAKVRYIRIVIDRTVPGIFGLEQIDTSSPVIVLEGPIDSLFIKNSVALCGAANKTKIPVTDPVYFLDQEPRNGQIVQTMVELIESGSKVVMMPRQYHEMDVNELVLGGVSPDKIRELALTHAFKGLKARVKLAEWKN